MRRQLVLLQRISAHASRELLLRRAHDVDERPTKSRGPAALFAGPDTAAKTRAVAALGGKLGLDVYRIDLTQVVSKYIGETEKNLRHIFDATRHLNAILFFDEAGFLFGKRTEVKDAHDRYANFEIGYFLGRAETCDGLVILSAKTSKGLSKALMDRVETVVEFPRHVARRKSGES